MAAQNQGGPGIDQFDLYFRRADLDNDGRISGAEAVSFFQGSGLAKQVLAQIWMHADHNRAGFLNRQEFYNALKLVTVAQSKRDLTPEIVKAALYGPAASKIPAPQINIPPPPAGQSAPLSVSATPQMSPAGSAGLLNSGIRGPVSPNMTMNQQMAPAGSVGLLNPGTKGPISPNMTLNQQMTPAGSTGLNPGVRGPVPPNMAMNQQMSPAGSTGLLNPGVRGPVPPNMTMNQQYFPSQGNQMIRPSNVVPDGSASQPLQSGTALPNTAMPTDWLGARGNTMTSGPTSQGPTRGFSPTVSSPLPKAQDLQLTPSQAVAKDSISHVSGNGPTSNSSGGNDLFSAIAPLPKKDSSSANSASSAPTSSALVPVTSVAQSSSARSPLDSLQSSFPQQGLGGQLPQTQPGGGVAQMPQTNAFSQSQPASQAMSSPVVPGISRGLGNSTPSESHPPWPKMTPAGIQKYSKVFMEVDSDRDGKITGDQARNLFLSWRLPREVLKQVWDLADQDNDSMLSLREFCIALYMMERYREGRSLPASLPQNVMFDETLMRMAGMPNSSYGNAAWGAAAGFRQMPGAPGSQQMPPGGGLRPPMQVPGPQVDAARAFNQGKSPTSQLDGSRPNQLGSEEQNTQELSPSVATDTEKKVEKVILDSKEKLQYYRAKMQDLVLYKSRCDSRLNEIIERASADKREAEMAGKKYEEKYKQVAEIASKLTIEEATFRENEGRKMELRQAIINIEQGGSADGILQVRADRIQSDLEELMKALSDRCKKHGLEIKSETVIELPTGWQPGIQEGAAIWDEDWDKFDDEGLVFDKDLSVDVHNETTDSKPKSTSFVDDMYPQDGGYSPDSSTYADGKSEKQSSRGDRVPDSESGYAHSEDDSARSPAGSPAHPAADFVDVFTKSEADNESHRFDDHGWGTFDGNDDVDSVWGFNANSKDQREDRLFDSGSFGSSPVKTTDSPRAEGNFRSKPSPFFADSVPGTPFSKAANSPRYSEAGDNYFDNFSRFDSFSMSDSRFSPPRETFSRFDSINSGPGETFAKFDSVNSSKGEAMFGRFDSSRGFNSFDDTDPFGSSGPFKAASESHTPKKSSDGWSSF